MWNNDNEAMGEVKVEDPKAKKKIADNNKKAQANMKPQI